MKVVISKYKKVIVFVVILVIFILSIFIYSKFIYKGSKVNSNKGGLSEIVIKDNYYKGEQYDFKRIYKYEDESYCGHSMCNNESKIKERIIIKSVNSDAKEFDGNDYSSGVLFQDSYSIKLVDVKKYIMEKFEIIEGAKYRVLVGDGNLKGFAYYSPNESGFYNYNSKNIMYKNFYDEIYVYGNLLFSIKDDLMHILDFQEEKVLKEIKAVDFSLEDIDSYYTIDDYFHIKIKKSDEKIEYLVLNLLDYSFNRISGLFDEMFLYDKVLYFIRKNNVKVYDFRGELINDLKINLGNKSKIIANYILTNFNGNLISVNLNNGEENVLIRNLGNLWFEDGESRYKDSDDREMIRLSIRQDSVVSFPREYDVIFDVEKNMFEVRKLDNY